MDLEQLDTSDWLTKDKAWVAERKAKWEQLEPMLLIQRKKTEVNAIKQYFLRGKQPNWKKYQDWDKSPRPLNLFLFLWLHPSDDVAVLSQAYRAYMESKLIHPKDIPSGFGEFMTTELSYFSRDFDDDLEAYAALHPYVGEKNITLFRVMYQDHDYIKAQLKPRFRFERHYLEAVAGVFRYDGYISFMLLGFWLLKSNTSPFCRYSLFQYPEVLELCLASLPYDKSFIPDIQNPIGVATYQKALYRIYHFDLEQEGDTPRANAVRYLRKRLDELECRPEFKQMWQQVKAGEVEVNDPWVRER
ncbi:hypothetical protein [Motilimonas eburnea]|uniref:hypothetical protein n=1 Tax=Motilimonas eburnea TaxID=1737488 RepID=UPI001E2AF9DA|nr:hypothetical protein [Motilimonas eburnea]MCE2572817.1 hypothetical protein [Motilimonas eburnea]